LSIIQIYKGDTMKKTVQMMFLIIALVSLIIASGCGNEEIADDDARGTEFSEENNAEDQDEMIDVADEEEAAGEKELEVPDAPGPAGDEPVEVTTEGFTFSPNEVKISTGSSVLFNLGRSHNAVEVSEENWEAGRSQKLSDGFSVDFGGSEEVNFDEPGIYYYVCQPHIGMGMKGKIVVQ
jgi:plastocyanin